MSYERFEVSPEPRDPGEWLDNQRDELADRVESARIELAGLEDSRDPRRFAVRRFLEVSEERMSNLEYLREEIGEDYSSQTLGRLWEIYHQQRDRQEDVNQGLEKINPHTSQYEQFVTDGIGDRLDAATMDTLRLVERLTSHLEDRN